MFPKKFSNKTTLLCSYALRFSGDESISGKNSITIPRGGEPKDSRALGVRQDVVWTVGRGWHLGQLEEEKLKTCVKSSMGTDIIRFPAILPK